MEISDAEIEEINRLDKEILDLENDIDVKHYKIRSLEANCSILTNENEHLKKEYETIFEENRKLVEIVKQYVERFEKEGEI